jgi:hypothetical protein
MHAFFQKYPMAFAEMTAIKMIHKQIECAQQSLKEDKTNPKYLQELAKVYEMLTNFFIEKGYNPTTLT